MKRDNKIKTEINERSEYVRKISLSADFLGRKELNIKLDVVCFGFIEKESMYT